MRDNKESPLRFEDGPQDAAPRTSGRLGPKSKRKKSQQRRIFEETNKRPVEAGAPEASPSFVLEPDSPLPIDGDAPQGAAPTSGQLGPKSRQYRQHSQQARPSDKAHPGKSGKNATRQYERLNQSKLRTEKTGARLETAQEKLASQKPPKQPGPVKAVGGVAGYQAHRYVHGKIHEVEHENVAVEAAHRTEIVGERAVRGGTRFVKNRVRTRPARQVRKWEKKDIKARADHTFRELAQEHPELKSNPVSRALQKRKLKKQYAKQTRETAKRGAKAAKTAAEKGKELVKIIARHRKGIAIVLALAMMFMLMLNAFSSCSVLLNGGTSAVMASTYPSKESDMLAVEGAYATKESALQNELNNYEALHPGADEYIYHLDSIGHDPHELAAYLSAAFQEYTLSEVESELQRVFAYQYTLTAVETVETRYRTETQLDPETGESVNVTVPYEYKIVTMTLKNNGISGYIQVALAPDQLESFNIYRASQGNMPLLFGGGSSDSGPSVDLSGVHFINGERPGNMAVVDIGISQVGNVGGQPYWSWYGWQSRVAWCACFVSWCINQAGSSEPFFAYCPFGATWFSERGQWAGRGYEHIAPGDVIFFDWEPDGSTDHVGIVIGKDATHVYTVEGNPSPTSLPRARIGPQGTTPPGLRRKEKTNKTEANI